MNNILKKAPKCWHQQLESLFDVVGIDYGKQTVRVVKTAIKSNNEVVDQVETNYTFDEIDLLVYTGKKDNEDREILEGDIISYGDELQFTGEVVWNSQRMCWMIKSVTESLPFANGSMFYLTETQSKYLHVIENRYESKQHVDHS